MTEHLKKSRTQKDPRMLDATKSVRSATFHAEALKQAVNFAAMVVERRTTIPILATIRLTVGEFGAVVCGTDLDIEIFANCDAVETIGTLDFTIAPRLLKSLLRWSEGEVIIRQEGDLVTILVDDVEAKVRSLCDPRTDWPSMKSFEAVETHLGEAVLQRAISACVPCISTEETRYYLNGIYWHQIAGGLCLVATDGHRLARYQTEESWPFESLIVPKKTIFLLQQFLRRNGNGQVFAKAARDSSNEKTDGLAPRQPTCRLELRGDRWKIVSKTIDGSYPDYTRVIPTHAAKITATITHNALRRFGETSERSRAIMIDPVAGRMSYYQPDGPIISMPVQANGSEPVGFNLGYLRQFSAKAGTIRIEMNSAGDPAKVLTDDPNLLQILMPMRV